MPRASTRPRRSVQRPGSSPSPPPPVRGRPAKKRPGRNPATSPPVRGRPGRSPVKPPPVRGRPGKRPASSPSPPPSSPRRPVQQAGSSPSPPPTVRRRLLSVSPMRSEQVSPEHVQPPSWSPERVQPHQPSQPLPQHTDLVAQVTAQVTTQVTANLLAAFRPGEVSKGEEAVPISLHVSEKLKFDIWGDKPVDMAQLLPPAPGAQSRQAVPLHVETSASGALTFFAQDKASQKDLSVGDWSTAFLIYMDIYITKFPETVHGLLTYMSQVRQLHAIAGLRAMNDYDRAYRSFRQTRAWPWGKLMSDEWVTALGKRVATVVQTKQQAPYRGRSSSASTPQKEKCCRDFNKGNCTWTACKYVHSCHFCSGNHAAVKCPSTKMPATVSSQSAASATLVTPQPHASSASNQSFRGNGPKRGGHSRQAS